MWLRKQIVILSENCRSGFQVGHCHCTLRQNTWINLVNCFSKLDIGIICTTSTTCILLKLAKPSANQINTILLLSYYCSIKWLYWCNYLQRFLTICWLNPSKSLKTTDKFSKSNKSVHVVYVTPTWCNRALWVAVQPPCYGSECKEWFRQIIATNQSTASQLVCNTFFVLTIHENDSPINTGPWC